MEALSRPRSIAYLCLRLRGRPWLWLVATVLLAPAGLPASAGAAPDALRLRSSSPPPGSTLVSLNRLPEPDDIQRVLVDGAVFATTTGDYGQAFSFESLPPTAQITFEAENVSGFFSWDVRLGRVGPDSSVTTTFRDAQFSSVGGRFGIVRRTVLTPNGDVLGQCGEALFGPPCIPPPDADSDGVAAALDCDDTNGALRPGAAEQPGNAVDENCDGRADPFPRVSGSVILRSIPLDDGRTRVASLAVRGVSPASTIRLACTGTGCGRLRRTAFRPSAGADTVSLTRRVRRLRLAPGARLSVRISAPDRRTGVLTFTFRPRLAPTLLQRCADPGRSALSAC